MHILRSSTPKTKTNSPKQPWLVFLMFQQPSTQLGKLINKPLIQSGRCENIRRGERGTTDIREEAGERLFSITYAFFFSINKIIWII